MNAIKQIISSYNGLQESLGGPLRMAVTNSKISTYNVIEFNAEEERLMKENECEGELFWLLDK
jgi:hypothetical protein